MARDTELTAKVSVEGARQAERELDQLAETAEELDKPVELQVKSNLSKALSDLDKLNEEARATAVTAEELGRALGPELAGRADMDALIGELKQTGLTLEDITANADELAAKLREVDSDDLGGGLGRALGTAKGKQEELNVAVGKGQSVAANAYGNMAQDIGSLAGVAGTAGVAFGQMGEYIADAFFETGNLKQALTGVIATAGPLAGVAVGMQLLQAALDNMKADKAFNAQVVDRFAESLRQGTDAAQTLREELVETGKLDFSVAKTGLFALGTETRNIAEDLADLNISYDQFIRLAESGQNLDLGRRNEFDETDRAIIRVNDALGDYRRNQEAAAEATQAAAEALGYNSVEAMNAAEGWATFNRELENAPTDAPRTWEQVVAAVHRMRQGLEPTAAQLQAIADTTARYGVDAAEVYAQVAEDEQEAADAARELAEAHQEQRDALEEALGALQEYDAILKSQDWAAAAVEGATTAWEELGDAQLGAREQAGQAWAAYDALGEAVKKNGLTFDFTTEAGRQNAAQLRELYQSLLPDFTRAYTDAGGSVEAFGQNMDTLRSQVFDELTAATGLTADQVNALIDQLGVFDGSQYSSQFELLGVADANAKLALLSGVLSSLPPDVQRQVTLSVLAGDPQAALDAIEAGVLQAPLEPVSILSQGDPSGAAEDFASFADGEQPTATIPADADLGEAEEQRDDFLDKTGKAKPVVTVDADTKQAIALMLYLKVLSAVLQPVVTVTANTDPAVAQLNAVQRLRPQVPVEAYLADYPTAAEIQARIGRPRIPVDIVVGQSIRITGVRE